MVGDMLYPSQQTLCLSEYMGSERPDLAGHLKIFISLVRNVYDIHRRDCIYNDLNPDNILIDTTIHAVTLVQSEISSDRDKNGAAADKKADTISGKIAYVSPEQTGRTAHPVDFRSNFYSLGVIFYQMLTGSVPFAFEQPHKIIHAHIAITPSPVIQVNPEIPVVLSHIASKLLAKKPADRYQNAASLIADLETCVFQLETTQTIQLFQIAQNDVSPIFEIPQKLYGRSKEIKLLTDVYHHIQSKGIGIIFCSGPPGIGKSFLVDQVQTHFFENNGYFISGKFDQYETSIPCSAIIQAFACLIHRMLTLGDKDLAEKRKIILDALGDNGQLIINVIPELELIIGKQPVPEKLSLIEARNRFNYTFQKFVRSITDNTFPLIIFMDDLHWAENASLNLLETVLSDVELRNVLFIGAYRDIEGRENPFLGEFIDRIRQKKPDTRFMALGPVENEYVELLIEDMLSIEGNDLEEFIGIVATKTNCNPLFIREFLINLYEEELLRFTSVQEGAYLNRWRIDIDAIRAAKLPDTVVELLTERIKKLTAGTQDTLKIAACIGTRFSPALVAEIHQNNSAEIEKRLKEALDQGMVIRSGKGFTFIHDRVREAAYQLNEPRTRMMTHHAIGKALLPGLLKDTAADVFTVTFQLNAARQLLDPDELNRLVQLNLSAGKKAKRLTAYPIALDYFKTGIDLLGGNAWQTQSETALKLYTEAAEAAYLSADFEQAEKLVNLVITNTHTLMDRMQAYEIQLRCLVSQHRYSDAIREGLAVLDQLGNKTPLDPGKLRILREFIAVSFLLRRGTWQHLKMIKETDDPLRAARGRIMGAIGPCIYSFRPKLMLYIALRGLKADLTEGPTPLTAILFAYYSSYLCAAGKTDIGQRLAQSALELIKRSDVAVNIRANVSVIIYFGMCWKDHIRQTLTPLLDTYTLSMESGNPESAALAAIFYCNNALNAGIPLPDMLSKIIHFSEIFESRGQTSMLAHLRIMHWAVSYLMGLDLPRTDIQRGLLDKDTYLQSGDLNLSVGESICLTILDYFNGNYFDALTHSSLAIENLKHDARIHKPMLYFYDSLIRLGLIRTQLAARKTLKPVSWQLLNISFTNRYHFRKIAGNQKILKRAAGYSPVNFLKNWMLIEADLASVRGKKDQAITYYKKAIDLSKEHTFLSDEALFNEVFAKHLWAQSDKTAAEKHLKAAIVSYGKWGAERRKVQLLREYQSLFHVKNHTGETETSAERERPPEIPSRLNLAELDLKLLSDTLNSASQTDVQTYLQILSENIMHFAGAQRVLLLLNKDRVSIGVDNRFGKTVETLKPVSVPKPFPDALIQYVMRTRKAALIEDATASAMFATDPYIKENRIKSAICIPLVHQGKLNAILYLENNLNTGVFTAHHLKMLTSLCYQTALFLEKEFLKDMHSNPSHPPMTSAALFKMLQNEYRLTPQEANISVLLKEGHTRSQICESLNISANTLKRHLQMIYDKTVNFEDGYTGGGRADKLSRLILFLFKRCETPALIDD